MERELKLFATRADNLPKEDWGFFDSVEAKLREHNENIDSRGRPLDMDAVIAVYAGMDEYDRGVFKDRLIRITADVINGEFRSHIQSDPDYYVKPPRREQSQKGKKEVEIHGEAK